MCILLFISSMTPQQYLTLPILVNSPPCLNIFAYLVEWTWLDVRVADEIDGALNVQTELCARHKSPEKVVSKCQFSVWDYLSEISQFIAIKTYKYLKRSRCWFLNISFQQTFNLKFEIVIINSPICRGLDAAEVGIETSEYWL